MTLRSPESCLEIGKINGILEIVNKNLENVDIINFVFDAELIEENIQIDGKEISDVKWFTYEEILQYNFDRQEIKDLEDSML